MRQLPDFPWDSLAPVKERASAFSDPSLGPAGTGLVDLSVGTPVDPTPRVVREALAAASDAHGYPLTWGTADLREAVSVWFAARRGVPDVDPAGVLPTIGSKELVAWLPILMGLGPGDVVASPRVAYPTYDVGARLSGATPMAVDALTALGPLTPSTHAEAVVAQHSWQPDRKGARHRAPGEGRRLGPPARGGRGVRRVLCRARLAAARGRLREPPTTPSILDPRVTGGSHEGLLCVYSLSKQSNLAGYRGAFVAGDPALVGRLLEVRKHAGMMVPWPVQRAVLAALSDAAHVEDQKERYAARRAALLPAVERFGLRVDDSEAGLYLWATAGEAGRVTIERLAARGILAAPGDFYGRAGAQHVRIALTATDERVAAAVRRLG